jgi:UDP-GlcNAc:undecaprenyl-phosphate/decaprenyl-phosphate GlcNAc-1-phosphate transferase
MPNSLFLIFFLINIPVLIFFNSITKIVNIYDRADNIRKFHKNNIPLFGGIMLIYNLLFFFLLDQSFNFNLLNKNFNTREYFSFYIGIILMFIIGIYDDKYNLSANKKLFINFFVIFFLVLLDDNLVIKELSFSFLENTVELRNFSHFFTVLCILLFLNALNMFDGINLQVGFYCILIFFIFILKQSFISLSIILICILIIFLIYNFLNKIFLGDSGINILAFVISYILIKSHNLNQEFTPEEIFVILSFPGLDMFRLFLLRILNGKSPFNSDRNHIHHLILKKFNSFQAFLIIQIFIILNLILFYVLENKLNILLINLSSYLILFFIFTNRRKKD